MRRASRILSELSVYTLELSQRKLLNCDPPQSQMRGAGGNMQKARKSRSDAKVQLALSIVSHEYTSPTLSLEVVARRVRWSKFHLSRSIAHLTGTRFRDHLAFARLAAAQEALREGVLTIKEIAAACGFASTSSFDREFRRHCGCSPTQWRQREPNRAESKKTQRQSTNDNFC